MEIFDNNALGSEWKHVDSGAIYVLINVKDSWWARDRTWLINGFENYVGLIQKEKINPFDVLHRHINPFWETIRVDNPKNISNNELRKLTHDDDRVLLERHSPITFPLNSRWKHNDGSIYVLIRTKDTYYGKSGVNKTYLQPDRVGLVEAKHIDNNSRNNKFWMDTKVKDVNSITSEEMRILYRNMDGCSLTKMTNPYEPDVIIEPCIKEMNAYDFDRLDKALTDGAMKMNHRMSDVKKDLIAMDSNVKSNVVQLAKANTRIKNNDTSIGVLHDAVKELVTKAKKEEVEVKETKTYSGPKYSKGLCYAFLTGPFIGQTKAAHRVSKCGQFGWFWPDQSGNEVRVHISHTTFAVATQGADISLTNKEGAYVPPGSVVAHEVTKGLEGVRMLSEELVSAQDLKRIVAFKQRLRSRSETVLEEVRMLEAVTDQAAPLISEKAKAFAAGICVSVAGIAAGLLILSYLI